MKIGKRNLVFSLCLLVVIAGGAFAVYWADRDETLPIALRPADASVVAAGEKIYAKECASCHGANLEGQPNWRDKNPNGRFPAPPHDASGHTWHHPDMQLFELTKYGPAKMVGGGHQSDMPGYEDKLSDADIVAVLSFIKSKWPPVVQKRHDQMNARFRMQAPPR